ncbi:unnamed protein product, partial [Nesidiocoris tenuis]
YTYPPNHLNKCLCVYLYAFIRNGFTIPSSVSEVKAQGTSNEVYVSTIGAG